MNLVHRPLNKGNIIFVCLLALIPSVIITSYSVTELSVSRDSYSTDKYILFEDRNGVDQFWVDGDGFVFANGTLLSGGGTMEQLTNVTSFGCADGQNLQVNSSGIWACATPSAGGGFSTVYKTADETINNDAVLTDDADLQFSVDANSSYMAFAYISANTDSAADFRYALSSPSGSEGGHHNGYMHSNTSTGRSFGSVEFVTTFHSSNFEMIEIVMIINVGSTPGTFAFQWAQQTADAADTTLKQGSAIMYKKLN